MSSLGLRTLAALAILGSPNISLATYENNHSANQWQSPVDNKRNHPVKASYLMINNNFTRQQPKLNRAQRRASKRGR